MKLILFIALAAILLVPIALGLVTTFFYGIYKMMNFETRFRKYLVRYQNEEVARMVASGKLWTGQTRDQLRDARGSPDHIEIDGEKETWMYAGTALAPRGLRIVLVGERVQTWS